MDVVGIDVGGTRVKAGRFAVDGTELAQQSVATPSDARSLTDAVSSLATVLVRDTTVAVGVASPGVLDDGVVRYAANLPWRDEPVRDRLRDAVRLPVVLTRDVAAAALAESTALADGAALAERDIMFIAIGTGIACAHVVDGAVVDGASGQAGELGHIPVRPDGEQCACGQRGCLEVYASAAGLARRYAARTGRVLTSVDIVAGVDADVDAAAVWSDAVDAWALALSTLTLLADPGVIVLGGGLAAAGPALLDPVRTALAARLAWRPAPPLVIASLGPAAGRIGAAQLAWRTAVADSDSDPKSDSDSELAGLTGRHER